MNGDDRSAFRGGFLTRCRQANLSDVQAVAMAQQFCKQAFDVREILGDPIVAAAVPYIGTAALGFGLGSAAAKWDDTGVVPEEIRSAELVDAYRQNADRVRLRDRLMKMRQNARQGRSRQGGGGW